MSSLPTPEEEEEQRQPINILIQKNFNNGCDELCLLRKRIGSEELRLVVKELRTNYQNVVKLNVSGNAIGNEVCKHLGELLRHYRSLTELHIKKNKIDDNGLELLADALANNTTLTWLNLNQNQIGNEGCKSFFTKVLTVNTTLKLLYLDDNEIDDRGAKDIAEALKSNKTLTCLQLNQNPIGNEGCEALAEALEDNQTLEYLYLQGTNMDNEGIVPFEEVLRSKNSNIKDLILSFDNDTIEFYTTLNHLGRSSVFEEGKRYHSSGSRDVYIEKFILFVNKVQRSFPCDCFRSTYYISCLFHCIRSRPDIICEDPQFQTPMIKKRRNE